MFPDHVTTDALTWPAQLGRCFQLASSASSGPVSRSCTMTSITAEAARLVQGGGHEEQCNLNRVLTLCHTEMELVILQAGYIYLNCCTLAASSSLVQPSRCAIRM